MHRSCVFVIALLSLVGCSAGRKVSSSQRAQASAVDTIDARACDRICEASAACGDSAQACAMKCNEWLVERSRPGIASAAAKCAVPRIDSVCEAPDSTTKGAVGALVSCIDEAGRSALRHDNASLVVAARALCERGARCGEGGADDAEHCIQSISQSSIPRGLGIFGAIKPELVRRFAVCMGASDCGTNSGASACFGDMLGDRQRARRDNASMPEAAPEPEESGPPGTKI
ncbi:MAG: hypothetical protein NVS3B20_13850 [Polyangiales bacterium]